MNILVAWILNALAIISAAYLIPSVTVDGFTAAFVLAVVLGIINAFIRPILVILTLPINILSLGFFTLVINAGLVMLAANLVDGFDTGGFVGALIFSVVLAIINMFLGVFKK